MASRPEEIITTVITTLTGLTTTGAKVFRGRTYPLEATDLPALTVYQGSDTALGENGPNNFSKYDSDQLVRVTAHVKSTATQVETLLNKIRREVHVALMASHTQGLSYVITTIALGADEPVLSGEAEKPNGTMDIDWLIRYRSPVTDLEV